MSVNRKRHAVDGAAVDRWALLGHQLHARRLELGYPVREAFAIAKGLITAQGNPNKRMLNSVENNERQNYAPGRLEQFARAYEVTIASVYDLLAGKTDELEPVPQQQPAPVQGGVWSPEPPPDTIREGAARPFFTPLWDRLFRLGVSGEPDPDGVRPADADRWSPSAAQLGLSGQDAAAWDGSRGAMSLSMQAWHVSDLRAAREARHRDARTNGANTA